MGEEDGPFSYVLGSHKVTPQRMAWEKRISENADTIENKYSARGSLRIMPDELSALGYGQPVKMVVKANTLIVADTHGFHARCPSYKETTRVEIYGSLRRNPYLPVTGMHIASLSFVKARRQSADHRRHASPGEARPQRLPVGAGRSRQGAGVVQAAEAEVVDGYGCQIRLGRVNEMRHAEWLGTVEPWAGIVTAPLVATLRSSSRARSRVVAVVAVEGYRHSAGRK